MFKMLSSDGTRNLAGPRIRKYRLSKKMSVRSFSAFLQLNGLDWDYMQAYRAEKGERTITDIELKILSDITKISINEFLSHKR